MLTGFSLASARGLTQIGDQVVLCSGEMVVLTYGPDGEPSESPHYCPDMAIGLLAAVAAPVPQIGLVPRVLSVVYGQAARLCMAAPPVTAQARDPPVVSLA
ncbi:hypothetical protein CUV01_10345 [Paracoccus tegillarcae]|uniref:Uncharacterized protein n=1 Tax=Paracoccus tegillarcae TaxID=1529068 RepID=A0A2K9EQ07_9RHOB|nr:hypothetical protein CUV01_10345 [Paracoccus tegillarcae]